MPNLTLIRSNAIRALRAMPDGSVDCVITSPPYWGLRDYGVRSQIGLEKTPQKYVRRIVKVFREVRRVLSPTGTLWLNMGDSYAQGGRGGIGEASTLSGTRHNQNESRAALIAEPSLRSNLKPKDMLGMPWRVAFALQKDGWYLRSDIIWSKPNPMPESVLDRPTKAHEYLFLFSRSEIYHYDADAIREPYVEGVLRDVAGWASGVEGKHTAIACSRPPASHRGSKFNNGKTGATKPSTGKGERQDHDGRNKRSVWTIPTQPYAEAHFATYPEKLIEPCVLAGCPPGGVVLDPFMGSGTTGVVALRNDASFIGIEINKEYFKLAKARIEPERRQLKMFEVEAPSGLQCPKEALRVS